LFVVVVVVVCVRCRDLDVTLFALKQGESC